MFYGPWVNQWLPRIHLGLSERSTGGLVVSTTLIFFLWGCVIWACGGCLLQFWAILILFSWFPWGKGVATAMGGLLGLMPACLLVGLFVWGLTFYLTKYVAVASIAFGLSLPVCCIVFSTGDSGGLGKTILACGDGVDCLAASFQPGKIKSGN